MLWPCSLRTLRLVSGPAAPGLSFWSHNDRCVIVCRSWFPHFSVFLFLVAWTAFHSCLSRKFYASSLLMKNMRKHGWKK
jgi:hypothetical protein